MEPGEEKIYVAKGFRKGFLVGLLVGGLFVAALVLVAI